MIHSLLQNYTISKKLALAAFVISALAMVWDFYIDSEHDYTWNYDQIYYEGNEIKTISAFKLSQMLIEKENNFLLLDSRSQSQYDKYHIPFAELYKDFHDKKEINKIIIYAQDEEIPINKINSLKSNSFNQIYVLYGGINEWIDKILFPDLLKRKIRNEQLYKKIVTTSHYFGGKPKVPDSKKSIRANKYLREGC